MTQRPSGAGDSFDPVRVGEVDAVAASADVTIFTDETSKVRAPPALSLRYLSCVRRRSQSSLIIQLA
jgi:hypothetical protein